MSKLNRRYPLKQLGTPQAKLTPRQTRKVFEKVGFTPAQALQMSQITHGESGYQPGVVQPDPGDGMVGYGLTQVTPNAWGTAGREHMQKLGGLEAMGNPVQNAKMAKYLFDEAGESFKPWYGTRYLNKDVDPKSVHSVLGKKSDPMLRNPRMPGDPKVTLDEVTLGQKETFDKAGFEQAQRRTMVAQMLQRNDPKSFLAQILGTTAPDASEFTTSRLTSKTTPGGLKVPKVPKMDVADPGHSPAARAGVKGKVVVSPGADRPGVATQPIVKSFVSRIAGQVGKPVVIGTGTNHRQMTTSGNVSDHWSGHAADLPMPVDSRKGDLTAAAALNAAGVPYKKALSMARKGGVFNVTPTSGPYKGRRVQVLWKTYVGGNHHGHVHVGIQ